MLTSLMTSRIYLRKNPSGNVGLNSGAFLLTTELFERTNQIPIPPIKTAQLREAIQEHTWSSRCCDYGRELVGLAALNYSVVQVQGCLALSVQ